MIFNQVIPQIIDNSLNPIIEKTIINYTNSEVSHVISYAFQFCPQLISINFPNCLTIGTNAFAQSYSLETISFAKCTEIDSFAFGYCSRLTSAYFMGSSVPSLNSSNIFYGTPMVNSSYTGSFGSIYVPASLLTEYKTATFWSNISDRIVGV